MRKRISSLLLLLLVLGLSSVVYATEHPRALEKGLRASSEPAIIFTTSTEIGADCSFTVILPPRQSIRIDWGDGRLVSSQEAEVKGKKAGEEIKIYGDFLSFSAAGAGITSIQIQSLSLAYLILADNELTTLDLSNAPGLERISAPDNKLTNLKVDGLNRLTTLNVRRNNLESLTLANLRMLKKLYISGNPTLTMIDVANLTKLTEIEADACALEEVYLPKSITTFSARGNQLFEIDYLSTCTKLTQLDVAENNFASLSLKGLTRLKKLDCSDNELTALDLTPCTALNELRCHKNAITEQAMKQLFESLPKRTAAEPGTLYAVNSIDSDEKNQVNAADVKIATDKYWTYKDYKECEAKVLFTTKGTGGSVSGKYKTPGSEQELTLSEKEAKMLPIGTVVTLTATVNDGYEVTYINSNQLAPAETLSEDGTVYTFTVSRDATVRITFAEKQSTKRYKVSCSAQPSEGGTVKLFEENGTEVKSESMVDANTTLRVEVTPADKYELEMLQVGDTKLPAGDEKLVNIAGGGVKYTFTVTAATKVQATFKLSNSIEQLAQSGVAVFVTNGGTRLEIAGAAEGTEVRLYDYTGQLLLASTEQALDISALPAGSYIVLVGDYTTRIVK